MVALTSMVDYSVDSTVAILTLNNPPVNALSQGVRQGIKEGVDRALADDSVQLLKTEHIPEDIWGEVMALRDEIVSGSMAIVPIFDAQEVRALMNSVEASE